MTRLRTGLLAFLVVVMALGGAATPASAATVSCTATQEICRVTLNSASGTVTAQTVFPGVGSANKYYAIVKGVYGATICTGTMSYNSVRNCNLGSYTGQVTFEFAKSQNTVGTIKLNQQ